MSSFYRDEFLAPSPTLKLEYHLLSGVRYCLFNILAATHHPGSRFSILHLSMRHAVVTGNRLSWEKQTALLTTLQ
jgi:hypothetical protein